MRRAVVCCLWNPQAHPSCIHHHRMPGAESTRYSACQSRTLPRDVCGLACLTNLQSRLYDIGASDSSCLQILRPPWVATRTERCTTSRRIAAAVSACFLTKDILNARDNSRKNGTGHRRVSGLKSRTVRRSQLPAEVNANQAQPRRDTLRALGVIGTSAAAATWRLALYAQRRRVA